MNETDQTIRRLLTPRKIAWVVLLGGLFWFVIASPKTPLQFFDAACRDQNAVDVLTGRRANEMISNHAQALQTLKSVNREMNRMALSYDIIHHPARVQQERSSIQLGFYDASRETHEAMMQHHRNYRALAEQFEKLKMDLKASRDSASGSLVSRHAQEEDKNLRIKRFQAEMERMILRKFQAKLFWRADQ